MHRNEYRRMAHEEVEEIFREILLQGQEPKFVSGKRGIARSDRGT